MNKYKRVVLKIGSSLVSEDHNLSKKRIIDLSNQISTAIKNGIDFVIVTSGAISQGMNLLGINERPSDLNTLQALAAIGQQQLMSMYENIFKKLNLKIAQVLLTHGDMNDKERCANAKNTIRKILKLKVIPIINENDVVATEEIKFGDNDTLASMVVNLIDADLMIILTNQDGLFDKNPDKHNDAKLINECNILEIDDTKFNIDSKSKYGTGGFETKLKSVKIAANSGAVSVVASGSADNVINKILNHESIGTIFTTTKNQD